MSTDPMKEPMREYEVSHANGRMPIVREVSRAADVASDLHANLDTVAAAIARRGFVLAGLGAGLAFLAGCASTPKTSSRGTNGLTLAGGQAGDNVGAGPWGADGELPPKRYAQPVSPTGTTGSTGGAGGRSPTIAGKSPRTVGPDAKPAPTKAAAGSSAGASTKAPNAGYASGIRVPATYDGTVIPRAAWTNFRPPAADMDRMPKVTRITVHHEGNRAFTATSVADCRARLVNVMNGEMNARVPHKDIAYHYVIDPAGRVWEARDLRYEGRHTRNNHDGNLGVMCLGNFEEQSISPAQLAALEKFLKSLQAKHKVSKKRVYTHQELSPTLCPGKDLQRRMGTLRSRLA